MAISRVHDADLEFMVDVMRGHREASDCDHSRELADAVVAELRALREVAAAAKELLEDWADEDDNDIQTRLDVIELRLKKAGL